MSLSAAAIRLMASKGMTAEDIADIAEAMEAPMPTLSPGAIRTRKWREKKEAERHRDVTVTPPGDVSHVRERAQVVVLSSSSLRSEEGKEPTSSNEDVPPLRVAKPNGFARFWEAYPNKVGKTAAEGAYAKALKRISGPDPPGVLLAGVERAKASRAWAEGFIPHPTTWLRQGRWEDEPAEVNPQPRKADERPHHDAKFAARQANLARAFAGSESAALRRR